MTRTEAWLTHASNALVAGTGLVYGWMRYYAEPRDEFAVVNHPLEPDLQHLHILFAPLLVFACALIWRDHVWNRIQNGHRPRRRMGLVLAACLFPMIASGYLLQVSSQDPWTVLWIVVHVVSSCAWLLAYLTHLVMPAGNNKVGIGP